MNELISRRALLKGGVAVGAALGVVAGARLPAPSPGRLVLSETEAGVVAAIALTLFPGGPMPLDGVQAGVVDEVDRILHGLRSLHAGLFRYLLRGIELGAIASHGARFTALDPAARTEVLEAWSEPDPLPRRVASDSLKMVLAMAYFSNPTVQDAMGYRATCGGGMS